MNNFIFIPQQEQYDCGIACLDMICRNHDLHVSRETLITWANYKFEGLTMQDISDALHNIGFITLGVNATIEQLTSDIQFPCIAHINENHFVIIFDQIEDRLFIADPAKSSYVISTKEFLKIWSGNILVFSIEERAKINYGKPHF